ncbi:hypothetical protein [Sphingomonas sp. KR3-1]|uniref:hypothetical protein n=1 Tax=Sphingomonas sp. KR3-1 TaxID=3156611 RepID=UPI0032B41D0C
MSVRVEAEVIHLTGRCLAEDAEALLVALHEGPERSVDLAGAQRLHLAVVQLLLAARPPIRGVANNSVLPVHVVNLLQ